MAPARKTRASFEETESGTAQALHAPQGGGARRYVEIGELAVLEQLRRDALRLDVESIPVGPFARLDANAVAAMDGKTRGAITNVFGSQAAFQAETLALSAEDWVGRIEYPEPADFPTAEEWVEALLDGEAARGPAHGAEPEIRYASSGPCG